MSGRKGFDAVHELNVSVESFLKYYRQHSLILVLVPETLAVLYLLRKHLQYYEDIAKRTLHTDLDAAIVSGVEKLGSLLHVFAVSESRDKLENIKREVESLTPRLKMMEEQCAEGLYSSLCDEEDDGDDEDDEGDAVPSKMTGVSEVYEQLKQNLMSSVAMTSLVGMPGIGKTTLAKKLLKDPMIVERFERCLWVRVGKGCRVEDIPRRILAEMDPSSLLRLPEGDEYKVIQYLKESLKWKRYLIVLDDAWDKYMAYTLDPSHRYDKVDHPFLYYGTRNQILLTSRLQQLGISKYPFDNITMRLLNEKESWNLFCEKLFSGGPCPPQLEKVGKKIVKKCEGLPLTILRVARLLSKEDKTLEYWTKVAEKRNHRIFKEAFGKISKVVLPSYTYLPRILQHCFLYLGLFRQECKIPRSKLINLWFADRFDEINMETYLHTRVVGYLLELVSNNLLVVYQNSISNVHHTIKTCGLHSSSWHLSIRKAKETKFALVIECPDDCLGDGIKGQRRLSFPNNVLFGRKDVCQSVEDNCASSTRSLLCYGPYHQYQVPICFGLKLLRELDALLVRFYEFPVEVVQLVRLRYLALTLNGMIPASISQLSNLESLIVDQHRRIISCNKGPSYLPVEIWGMKELKLLQITGSDLPDPCGASLESVSTLSNVSARSCTEVIFNAFPNLNKWNSN